MGDAGQASSASAGEQRDLALPRPRPPRRRDREPWPMVLQVGSPGLQSDPHRTTLRGLPAPGSHGGKETCDPKPSLKFNPARRFEPPRFFARAACAWWRAARWSSRRARATLNAALADQNGGTSALVFNAFDADGNP